MTMGQPQFTVPMVAAALTQGGYDVTDQQEAAEGNDGLVRIGQLPTHHIQVNSDYLSLNQEFGDGDETVMYGAPRMSMSGILADVVNAVNPTEST